MARFLVVFSSAGAIAAADTPRDATAWAEELGAVYNKLDGFIVTYVSEGKNKRLDATLAMDRKSGLGSASILAVNDGTEVINARAGG